MDKTALITGINGQDSSFLAELLLDKGYKIIGLRRRASTNNLWRLKNILKDPSLEIVEGDMSDAVSIYNIIDKYKPDEIYNLAAMSFVASSFEEPQYTAAVNYIGVINVLEAVRKFSPKSKIYQASTSELLGTAINENGFQNENTIFIPQSPYAISKLAAHHTCRLYRSAYNMFICCGVLFNHEGTRRGEEFVTRKITKWIGDNYSRLKLGYKPILKEEKLNLGNLEASRDFGSSKDYVESMYLMLQQEVPDDYVIATGETHTIRELLDVAFGYINIIDWTPYIYINPKFIRPAEVPYLRGDMQKAREKLGWSPTTTFKELIEEMVEADIRKENV
jgi:GDPmannose 4,6-dehydratase